MKENIFYLFHVLRSSIPLNYVKKKQFDRKILLFPVTGYTIHLQVNKFVLFATKQMKKMEKEKKKTR